MFSVPGKYSGGAGSGYTWTQTLNEVEIRVPLPADAPDGKAASCKFSARRVEAAWAGGELAGSSALPEEDLNAVVVVDDCLWVVERDAV